MDEIVISNIDTNLRKFTISTDSINTPGYNIYVKFHMENYNNIEESTLLHVLKLFYNVSVISNNGYFYFSDGITPFYVRRNKLEIYQRNFQLLVNKRLISANPLIKAILKDNNIVKKFKDYDIWYADYRAETKDIEDKLLSLIEDGYFVPSIDNPEKINLFNYERLKEYPQAIRGPELFGYRLSSTFYNSVLEKDSYVTVKINYKTDRRTLAGCIMASMVELCGSLVNCNICKETCNKIDCEELMSIKIGVDNISLRARDYYSLKKILEQTDIFARKSISYNVKDLEEGIQCRMKLNNTGFISLLLSDDLGYYVVVRDYLGKDPKELPILNNNITNDELEVYSSVLDNYDEYGKNYAHIGIYSVPGTLPGFLNSIPTSVRK